jgi:Fe-S oxidoreductase
MVKRHLDEYRANVFNCERCGICVHKYNNWGARKVCPAAEHSVGFEPYYARGKMATARGILEGRFDYSPAMADVLTWCTTCANCVQQCGCKNENTGLPMTVTPEIVEAMRADLFDLGMCPAPYKAVGARIEKERNPYGDPKKDRMKWAVALKVSFVGA